MADKDKTALSRTYVLKPSALKESKILEELAELARHADKPERMASDKDSRPKSSEDSPTSRRGIV